MFSKLNSDPSQTFTEPSTSASPSVFSRSVMASLSIQFPSRNVRSISDSFRSPAVPEQWPARSFNRPTFLHMFCSSFIRISIPDSWLNPLFMVLPANLSIPAPGGCGLNVLLLLLSPLVGGLLLQAAGSHNRFCLSHAVGYLLGRSLSAHIFCT